MDAQPKQALTNSQVSEIMQTLRGCFEKLGFSTFDDGLAKYQCSQGAYLVKRVIKPGEPVTEDDFWLRVTVRNHPGVGQVAEVDFRAGPNYWLQVNAKVPEGGDPA